MSKYCPWCESFKELVSFSENKKRKDGKQLYCRECINTYQNDKKRIANAAPLTDAELTEKIRGELEVEMGIKNIKNIEYEANKIITKEQFLGSKLFDKSERHGQWY
jgi:hypothetical protein